MKKQRRKKKIVLYITLILLLAVTAAAGFEAVRLYSGRNENKAADARPEDIRDAKEAAALTAATDIIFFASDYQKMSGWPDPSETLKGILAKVKEDGKTPNAAVICGDYTNDRKLHDYQLSPDASIAEIRNVITTECGIPADRMIFTQGNHDLMTDAQNATGLYEYDNYLVYVLNTQYDFPWKQGRSTEFGDRVKNASEEMKQCFDKLISAGETRPVFIAGHVPIHFTARTSSRHNTGDNLYSEYIFDVVNEAAKSLDIVYFAGHNHSKGWDCYIGGSSYFKAPGETILIPDRGSNTVNTDTFTEETLNFTYMNAGYLGYYMNCGPEELDSGRLAEYKAADDTLTGTVAEVSPAEIVISRYSADGVHPLSWTGEADPYKGGIDVGLIGSEYYSSMKKSPVHISRKSAAGLKHQ